MSMHFVNLLDDLRRRSLRMAALVEDMLEEACDAVFQHDEPLARRVVARDAEVDAEEVAVETEVIRLLALYQPVGIDLRTLCTLLKVNNDLERIADCAVNIAERARHQEVQPLAALDTNLKQIAAAIRHILRSTIQAYGADDATKAREIAAADAAVDALYAQIIRQEIEAASKQPDRIAAHMDVISIAKNLERIADHATNIAEDVIFLSTGQIIRHSDAEQDAAAERRPPSD